MTHPNPTADALRWPRTLVTGASSGLGLALATQLARAGVPVIALARDEAALRALAEREPRVTPWPADLSRLDTLPALALQIVQRHPDLGCLVNNAGIQHAQRLNDAAVDAAGIRREIDVNLTAPLLLCHALLPQLQAQSAGCIVNIGSGLGLAPRRDAAVYSASKAGLRLFSQALRVQLRGSALRVVHVLPPLVDTPMTAGRGRRKLSADEAARQLILGLRRGDDEIRIGAARALPLLQRWAPGLLARLMQRD